jgi:hypothetical protein
MFTSRDKRLPLRVQVQPHGRTHIRKGAKYLSSVAAKVKATRRQKTLKCKIKVSQIYTFCARSYKS